MSVEKTTAREVHLAVGFLETCPPSIGRKAALAHAFAEYRRELARDPQFILAAAQDLLDQAACESGRRMHVDVSGIPAGSLSDAYAKLQTSTTPTVGAAMKERADVRRG